MEQVEALYDFQAQNEGDMTLKQGERIEVIEHLSDDWWKGKNLSTGQEGVFPSNYVKPAPEEKKFSRPAAPLPPRPNTTGQNTPPPQYYGQNQSQNQGHDYPQPYNDEKSQYQAPPPASWMPQQNYNNGNNGYAPPPAQYSQYTPYPSQSQAPQPMQQQPPPQPQQQQQQPQQQGQNHPHLHQFAQSFGQSVIFGAGATLGSDLINKIF